MDSRQYGEIKATLGNRVDVWPEPKEGENVQFVEVSFEPPLKAAGVLISLAEGGFIGAGAASKQSKSGPYLDLIGQHFDSQTQRPKTYLTFEDINHPNSV